MAAILDLTGKLPPNKQDTIYTSIDDCEEYNTIVTKNYIVSLPFADIPDEVQKLVDRLVPGGELHLIEPSLEWAAREILVGNIDAVRMLHIFGDEKAGFNKSGCTLQMLRDLIAGAGLVPVLAGSKAYLIAKDNVGNEYKGDQHYVVAVKPAPGEEKAWLT